MNYFFYFFAATSVWVMSLAFTPILVCSCGYHVTYHVTHVTGVVSHNHSDKLYYKVEFLEPKTEENAGMLDRTFKEGRIEVGTSQCCQVSSQRNIRTGRVRHCVESRERCAHRKGASLCREQRTMCSHKLTGRVRHCVESRERCAHIN